MTTSPRDSTAEGDPDLLRRNLGALAEVDAPLARRLDAPARRDHVRQGPGGAWLVRLHDRWLALAPEEERRDALVRSVAGAERVELVGVGLGELLPPLLRHAALRAWSHDPWLLRMALGRVDVVDALRDGRLRLALGSDLARWRADAGAWSRLVHPQLAPLNRVERAFLETQPSQPVALLARGGLFVGALGRALAARGYAVWPLDLEGLAAEECELAARELEAELCACVNWLEGLERFAHGQELECVCWEIDPSTSPLRAPSGSTERVHVFTWRRAHVGVFRERGFSHVEHLPLAAEPALRHEPDWEPGEREEYAVPIALVGTSMVERVPEYRALLLQAWESWRGAPAGESGGVALFEELLAFQRARQHEWVLPELLEERAPGLGAVEVRAHTALALLGEVAASEKRLAYAANLGASGLHAWGDAGWKLVERHGVRYRGPAGHERELTRIYASGALQLDLSRLYQMDIVTMRVFDVLACGGPLLCEAHPELERLFTPGVELDTYRDVAELKRKAAHWLERPEEARAMGERGRERVLAAHTIEQRVEHMLARVDERRSVR